MSFCTCGWAEREERHQSRRCFRVPTRERLERRMSNFVSLHLWQMYVSGTLDLRILAHERWIQVLHWLHSIIARPANGFMQKHVTRSQESSSAKKKTVNSNIYDCEQCQTPRGTYCDCNFNMIHTIALYF